MPNITVNIEEARDMVRLQPYVARHILKTMLHSIEHNARAVQKRAHARKISG